MEVLKCGDYRVLIITDGKEFANLLRSRGFRVVGREVRTPYFAIANGGVALAISSPMPRRPSLRSAIAGVVLSGSEVCVLLPAELAGQFRELVGRCREPESLLREFFLAVVESSFKSLTMIEEELDSIESLLARGHVVRQASIVRVVSNSRTLRRCLSELRYVINASLNRLGRHWISKVVEGLRDDVERLYTVLEHVRDRVALILPLIASYGAERLNRIVTKLTIVSVIFLPLTLIASIYGMNFRFMPGLNDPYAFYITMAVMAAISAVLLTYFKVKKWF